MKGILFKPWKVLFIAEHPDMELQTRRVIKPQPKNPHDIVYDGGKLTYREKITYTGGFYWGDWQHSKPHYQVGETVYIKEAWKVGIEYDALSPSGLRIHPIVPVTYKYQPPFLLNGRWRSPLFMPEWAARYFITITDVRAERLQEITEGDVLAEGITVMRGTWQSKKWNENTRRLELTGEQHPYTGLYHFEVIWDSINKDYPWENNPWVWVYTFKLTEKEVK